MNHSSLQQGRSSDIFHAEHGSNLRGFYPDSLFFIGVQPRDAFNKKVSVDRLVIDLLLCT